MGKEINNLKPILFDPTQENFDDFKNRLLIEKVIDNYESQLKELFFIRNPRFRFSPNYQEDLKIFLGNCRQERAFYEVGSWFYFPWNKYLIHYLSDKEHQELRTARNRNLITKEEQDQFYNFKVGIAGLSVGSHAALTLVMMGGGRFLKLADPDSISGSNLNRIRADFTKVGLKKADWVTEQIYQINPYSEIYSYTEGISAENVSDFVKDLDVMVDELDNFEMKIRLRIEAKRLRTPLFMATDNGDNVIFDVERYDLNRDLKIFNGAIGDFGLDDLKKTPPTEFPKIATKIAGPKFVVPRMLSSVMEVGKSLYSWPQLGDAAALSGIAVAYAVRKLSIGDKIKSGKFEINIDSAFDPDYSSLMKEREEERKKLLQIMGL